MQNYETNPNYMDIDHSTENAEYDSTNDYKNSDFKVIVDEFVDTFEKSKKKKIIKKKDTALELFMRVA